SVNHNCHKEGRVMMVPTNYWRGAGHHEIATRCKWNGIPDVPHVRKVCFITREYPPHFYGGARGRIRHLARERPPGMDVEDRCCGDQDISDGHLRVKGYQCWERMAEGQDKKFNSTLGTFSTGLSIVRDPIDADAVHSHTWYAAMAGFMAKQLYDVP